MIEQTFLGLVKAKTTWTTYLNHAIENQVAPYVVVHKVSAPRSYTNDGRDGMVVSRFQVDLYGSDYKTVKLEAQKLYSIADIESTEIAYVVLATEMDMFESDSGLHHVLIDYFVNHYE